MLTKSIKQDEYSLRNSVYQSQGERGLTALMGVLTIRRDTALGNFRKANGLEELVRWQTAYNEAQATIDLITREPRQFKQE